MKEFVAIVALFLGTVVGATISPLTTCDRVIRHGYSCLRYTTFRTTDGYTLTMFRMQRSPLPYNLMEDGKSVVLFMHGIAGTSDAWVLNGPDNGLVYSMADAGYDVWLGNVRSSPYSQQHVYLSLLLPPFWYYGWHEIGIYDIPAMMDYIKFITGQKSIHYVGHSQGATSFIVMLCSRPEYIRKIKTAHLLAPTIFMENMSSKAAAVLGAALSEPNYLATLMGTYKFEPSDEFIQLIMPDICKHENAPAWCSNLVFLLVGGPSSYTNTSVFEDFFATTSSDASGRQVQHYIQNRNSGEFRQYDFGKEKNLFTYKVDTPPDYPLQNINTTVPLEIYYSENDINVAVKDVDYLRYILGSKALFHYIKFPEFSHLDYLIGDNVNQAYADYVKDKINKFENKPFDSGSCYFRN